MPSKRKKAKAVPFNPSDVANIAKSNPYIQRLIDDAKLRDNVQKAIESTKSAYGRLSNGKAPAKALLEDKKLQKDLSDALEALRDASLALTDAPKKRARKGIGFGRKLLILAIGGGARAGRQREAPLQGARHPVRRRGGVRVHAARRQRDDAAGDPGQRRVAAVRHAVLVSRAPRGAPSSFPVGSQQLLALLRLQVLDRLADRHSGGSIDPRLQPGEDGGGLSLADASEDPADRLADEELALVEHRVGVPREALERRACPGSAASAARAGRPGEPRNRGPLPRRRVRRRRRGAS